MNGKHMLTRRALAILLIIALALPAADHASFAAPACSGCLDGWMVDCIWSNDSYSLSWNSTEDETYRPRLIFSYRLENAERDYAPGSIKVEIPGIGNSCRKGVTGAYGLPTDSADSEWDAIWDKDADVYTFTNRFDVKEGQSVNGGFEIIWELSGREIINGYSQNRSPEFFVEDAGSITLEPLSFSCSSTRDRYRIILERDSINSSVSDKTDAAHIWYCFKVSFEKDWLSRGLRLSDCSVSLESAADMDPEDFVTMDSKGNIIKHNAGPGGEISFYLFENYKGDLGTYSQTFSKSFIIGIPGEKMSGEELTVRVHLDRLYYDEPEWVTEAGKGEKVDQELILTVEDYSFNGHGLKYRTYIWNMLYENYYKEPYYYWYGYRDELTHTEPPKYEERLCAADLYNGTVVEFTLRGSAVKDYSPANVMLFSASPSDMPGEDTKEGIKEDAAEEPGEDAKEDTPEEYEEIILEPLSLATPSDALILQTVDTSAVSKAAAAGYSMVLGDDAAAIYLRDGSIRPLEEHEYDFTYVNVPSCAHAYSYGLYGADGKDAAFDDYELLAYSDMSTAKSFSLPDGIKAVYVKIDDVTDYLEVEIAVGLSLHLDWDEELKKDEEKRADHENRLVNFSYMRALCKDDQNVWYNDCAASDSDYGGSYGETLAEHDMELYGEWLLRGYSNVWLRNAVTTLRADIMIYPFEPGDDVSTSRIDAGGSIKCDSEGELKRFSVYTVLPDGINPDFYSEPLTVTGNLTTCTGDNVAYPEDYVSFSEGTYMGQRMLIADFDFSRLPLMAKASNRVNISYPVKLSRADQAVYGDSYTVTVYLLPHDEGMDKVTGTAIVGDIYDIDGNGNTAEKMACSGMRVELEREADEWREYAAKYVKSAFSEGYVKDAATTCYVPADDGKDSADAYYEYRLDLGLGASAAENIVFFDRLEQGARLAVNQSEGEYDTLGSEWQGQFISVDTSYARSLGFKAAVFYSTDAAAGFDLSSPGWTDKCPEDTSKVRSVAVSLDTSGLSGGVMKAASFVYVIIKMRAPENGEFTGKRAVNQYTVSYDSYGTNGAPLGRTALPSAATALKLLNGVGRMILQKVDADDIIRTDADGVPHYAPLTGGTFQIYDESGRALFDEPQALNSVGRLVVGDIPTGIYYWEEISAPEGYERIEGRHAFSVDGSAQVITVENHRLPDKGAPAVLTIDKKVNDVCEPFGDPTFIFKITRSDGLVYHTSVMLSPDMMEGCVSLDVEQGYTYRVEEVGVSRYLPGAVAAVENAVANEDDYTAVADLVANDSAEVKFYNEMEQYGKFSHSACVVNSVKMK